MPGILLDFHPTDYAIQNMLIQEKQEVLLLDLSLDEKDRIRAVSFKWIKKNFLGEEEIKRNVEGARKLVQVRFFTKMKNRDKKKIGRNESCPCGSGKKYKKCHGK